MAPATWTLPLTCLVPLLLWRALGAGAQAGRTFELQQPQDKVSVAAGETLTLTCTTSGDGPPGAVKWLKGWGSGNETVYDQTGSFPRVTRAVAESNTDFSIHIRDVRPEDAGTYYCVKFRKSLSGADEVFRRGNGTEVSLHVAMGSLSPIPLRCCAGTPSEVLGAETSYLPSRGGMSHEYGEEHPVPMPRLTGTLQGSGAKQSSKEDDDIHYADLQPLPVAPRHSRSPGAACSEYASIRVAAK
ncbi:PREDICTED: signal-regulatory protein beta-1-like [Phaethon lepturus]|uniref:signal-regulatory protein beta-1-like n=1 Tax=Phaethon lepturus TaxID=97097 RepID=UPI000530416B|nr:PREDICTED: signal-regulatory protein beta-1-like [Phaethon lepturus]